MVKRFSAAVVVPLALSAAVPASAALIASDEFTDTATTALAGDGGGTGFGANTWLVTPASSSAASSVAQTVTAPSNYPFTRSGGEMYLQNVTAGGTAGSIQTQRQLASAINFDADGVHYFSLLTRRNDAANGAGSEALYWLEGRATITASSTRVFGFGGNSTEQIVLTLNGVNSAGLGATPAYAIGTDYMLIGKIITRATGNDEIFMDLVPSTSVLASGEPTSYAYTFAAATTGTVATIGSQAPSGVDELRIDSLRYGSTYGDVSVVPEPAAIAVLGVAGALLRRRRGR